MDQIALFLHLMKQIVVEKGFILVDRPQSKQFLADFELTFADLQDVILSLEPSDCFDGPEPDRDPRFAESWTVAEFSPTAFDVKLYLKLSICINKDQCKCLSVKLFREKERS